MIRISIRDSYADLPPSVLKKKIDNIDINNTMDDVYRYKFINNPNTSTESLEAIVKYYCGRNPTIWMSGTNPDDAPFKSIWFHPNCTENIRKKIIDRIKFFGIGAAMDNHGYSKEKAESIAEKDVERFYQDLKKMETK